MWRDAVDHDGAGRDALSEANAVAAAHADVVAVVLKHEIISSKGEDVSEDEIHKKIFGAGFGGGGGGEDGRRSGFRAVGRQIATGDTNGNEDNDAKERAEGKEFDGHDEKLEHLKVKISSLDIH